MVVKTGVSFENEVFFELERRRGIKPRSTYLNDILKNYFKEETK